MDATNVVFNVFVGAILVVGAFGIQVDVPTPEPQATVGESFSKKIERPRAIDTSDACKLPECGTGPPAPKATFVQTKKVIQAPAPPPAWSPPVPATIKHGDDHPSTHSERGHDRDHDKQVKRAKELREKADDEERKLLEKAREQARKAAQQQRKEMDDEDDEEHEEDEKDEEDD